MLDNAGRHVSKKLVVPQGLKFCFLPSYSPELQPAERLWPPTDEAVANTPFETLDDLTDTLAKQCIALTDQSDLIKESTCCDPSRRPRGPHGRYAGAVVTVWRARKKRELVTMVMEQADMKKLAESNFTVS